MGAVPIASVLQISDPEPDTAVEVGAMPLRTPMTAMRVGARNGILIYENEEPCYIGMAWRIVEDAFGQPFSWWRLELKVSRQASRIAPGHDVIVAQHPYGNGWTHLTTIKPGSKKERTGIADARFGSVSDATHFVEETKHDFWETGAYLTAGISQPHLPLVAVDSVRNAQKEALYTFGICEALADAERALVEDQTVQRLIAATERGTLRFWAPEAKLTQLPVLLDEVKEDRWSLMALSIRQALAGPHRDSDDWVGRPVHAKVDQIYRGHVNRRNRSLTEELRRARRFG
ncbi:MAG: hypothetical protein AAF637_09345 [Pseudomonadota bacterium]